MIPGMVNARMPWQMTVRDLKAALQHAHPDAVVVLQMPPGSDGSTVIHNLVVPEGQTDESPVFRLRVRAE